MSGWERPTPPIPDNPAPRTYWSQQEADPLRAGQLIRRGWRLYRTAPRQFVAIAAITGSIQTLLTIPSLVSAVAFLQASFDVMADYFGRVLANPEAYRFADQQALQADMEARLRAIPLPGVDLSVLTVLGAGLSGAIGLIGVAALTAMGLSIAAGRPVPVPFAFRLVAARAGLVKPIVALGVGWAAVSWLSLVVSSSPEVQAWMGATGSPRSILIGSLLSVLALIVAVVFVVLAVRWALYVPAVLVEALGVEAGLARAAQLTSGIRIRIGLASVGILLLGALAIAVLGMAIGVAVGLAAGSVALGLAAYLVVTLVGNMLWAPWLPAMLAVIYRARTHPSEPSTGGDPVSGQPVGPGR